MDGSIYISLLKHFYKDKKEEINTYNLLLIIENFYAMIKSMFRIITKMTDKSNSMSLPFGSPLLRISYTGRIFVDLPVQFVELCPPEDQSGIAHPAIVTVGGDLGMREKLNCVWAQTDKIKEHKPNDTLIKETFVDKKFVEQQKRRRRARERVDYSAISNAGRKIRWFRVRQRKTNGAKQQRCSRAENQRIAFHVAIKTLKELHKISNNNDYTKFRIKCFEIYSKYKQLDSDYIDSWSYISKISKSMNLDNQLLFRMHSFCARMVFEDLSNFSAPGGDIFSARRSGATAWSGSGQFRKAIEQKAELWGMSVRFVPPHYTSKMFSISSGALVAAEAGYLVNKKNIANNKIEFKIFDSPNDRFYTQDEINTFNIEKFGHIYQYDSTKNVFTPVGESPPLSKGLKNKLLKLLNSSDSNFYVSISSGKWVRGFYNNNNNNKKERYYIDRDINAALNLARYNEFSWLNKLRIFHEERLNAIIMPKKSQERMNNAVNKLNDLIKQFAKKSLRCVETADYVALQYYPDAPPLS